jgi:hypothetical protein
VTDFENDLASRVAGAIQFPGFCGLRQRQPLFDVDAELSVIGEVAEGT